MLYHSSDQLRNVLPRLAGTFQFTCSNHYSGMKIFCRIKLSINVRRQQTTRSNQYVKHVDCAETYNSIQCISNVSIHVPTDFKFQCVINELDRKSHYFIDKKCNRKKPNLVFRLQKQWSFLQVQKYPNLLYPRKVLLLNIYQNPLLQYTFYTLKAMIAIHAC